jgi:hypothetical protein
MTPRPSDLGLRRQVGTPLARAVLAHARASYDPVGGGGGRPDLPARIVRETWPGDRAALRLVTRAASVPATTTQAGWAAELAQNTVSELLISLDPQSAGSALLRRGTMLTLARYGSITVPSLVASSVLASFVGQGGAIPIRQFDTSKSVRLEPRKMATGFSLSREMIESSNAEALIRMVMINSIAISLDAVLFGNTAGTAVSPPGLLAGITPITPTTGNADPAMRTDLANLAAAVAPIGGLDIVYIAAPGEAVKILASAGPRFLFPVLGSSAIPAKTVICAAPVAIVAAADPEVEIMESHTAVAHYDTAPVTDISTATSVLKSTFQTDTSVFRVIFNVDWGLLNAGGISFVQNVTW